MLVLTISHNHTRKFDHGLTQILHDDLHWLDVGMARLRSTSQIVAHRSQMLSVGSVSGQPHNN